MGELADRRKDEFIGRFFDRIPAAVAASFSDRQLAAIKMAFGARQFGDHRVDIRHTFRLGRWRWYLVLLIGADRRSGGRARQSGRSPFWTTANAIAITVMAFILLLAVLGALYQIKIGLGIDIVPGVDMLPDEALRGHMPGTTD